jgi:RIO kinase 1
MQEIFQIIEELRDGFADYKDLEYISEIKSGKEAEIHLIQNRERYLAIKHYKPDLKFASRKEYFTTGEILDSREGRAIKNNSKFGKKTVVSMWAYREFDALKKLYWLGADVPEVFSVGQNYLVQEYIFIDGFKPAPQLYSVMLSDEQAQIAFEQVADNITLFWENGYVHGDLSAYNILWDGEKVVIIDFPQVVMNHNQESPTKLFRDIDNVDKYFKKYEIDGYSKRIEDLREMGYVWFGIG